MFTNIARIFASILFMYVCSMVHVIAVSAEDTIKTYVPLEATDVEKGDEKGSESNSVTPKQIQKTGLPAADRLYKGAADVANVNPGKERAVEYKPDGGGEYKDTIHQAALKEAPITEYVDKEKKYLDIGGGSPKEQ